MKTSKTDLSGVFKIQQEEARLNNEALVRKSQTGFFAILTNTVRWVKDTQKLVNTAQKKRLFVHALKFQN